MEKTNRGVRHTLMCLIALILFAYVLGYPDFKYAQLDLGIGFGLLSSVIFENVVTAAMDMD